MMELEKAKVIADTVVKALAPYCERIMVAGSIRRQKPTVRDIDLVLVVRDRQNLDSALMGMGNYKMSGLKIARVEMDSIPLDIYFVESNIRLAARAKKRGWRLAASGGGLFNERGERIAGDTEESIYEALGVPYQRPERR